MKMMKSYPGDERCTNGHLWEDHAKYRVDKTHDRSVRFCGQCKKDSDKRRAERKKSGEPFVRLACKRGHPKSYEVSGPSGGTGNCAWCRHDGKIFHKYGLPHGTYKRLLDKQDGRCKICKVDTPSPDKFFHLDHCHTTQEIRGLLCPTCNRGLGSFHDDIDKLAEAIKYLSNDNYEGIYVDIERLRKFYPDRF